MLPFSNMTQALKQAAMPFCSRNKSVAICLEGVRMSYGIRLARLRPFWPNLMFIILEELPL